MKIVINKCFGGFGLSNEAYEKLIEWGVPVRAYTKEPRNPKTGLYDIKVESNEGEIIFDRSLGTINSDELDRRLEAIDPDYSFMGRYWDTWTRDNRTHPLLIKVVEELGDKANGRSANLKVVDVPDGTDYEIDDYDGQESVEEKHNSWS